MPHRSLIACSLLALAVAATAEAPKAVPKVDWTDPAGDVDPGDDPSEVRDVVKLELGSDGKSLRVTATLAKEDHAKLAGTAVALYLDTDDRTATGGLAEFAGEGFEAVVRLAVCQSPDGERVAVCAGGIPDSPIKSRHARAVVEKFTGKPGERMRSYDTLDMVVSGFGAADAPLTGKVLAIAVPYETIGVKPGQTVRVRAREWDQRSAAGLFPEVRLVLQ